MHNNEHINAFDEITIRKAAIKNALASLGKDGVRKIVNEALEMNLGGPTLNEYVNSFKDKHGFLDIIAQSDDLVDYPWSNMILDKEAQWLSGYLRKNVPIFWDNITEKAAPPSALKQTKSYGNHWPTTSGFLFYICTHGRKYTIRHHRI